MSVSDIALWLTALFTGLSAAALLRQNLRKPSLHVDDWEASIINDARVGVRFKVLDGRGVSARLAQVKVTVDWVYAAGEVTLDDVYVRRFVSAATPYRHEFTVDVPAAIRRGNAAIVRVVVFYDGGPFGLKAAQAAFSARLDVTDGESGRPSTVTINGLQSTF